MKDSTTLTSGWVSFAVVFVLMGWSVAFPVTAAAQGQGQNGGWPALSHSFYSLGCPVQASLGRGFSSPDYAIHF
jgi:hypothetical protein